MLKHFQFLTALISTGFCDTKVTRGNCTAKTEFSTVVRLQDKIERARTRLHFCPPGFYIELNLHNTVFFLFISTFIFVFTPVSFVDGRYPRTRFMWIGGIRKCGLQCCKELYWIIYKREYVSIWLHRMSKIKEQINYCF